MDSIHGGKNDVVSSVPLQVHFVSEGEIFLTFQKSNCPRKVMAFSSLVDTPLAVTGVSNEV